MASSTASGRLGALVLMVVMAFPMSSWSAETAVAAGLTQIGPGVSVDVTKHEVYLDATVCLRRGILEYLICAKRTFEHESIFASEGKASHLHLGLLLIGGEPYAYSPTDDWPAQVREHGSCQLVIAVEYEEQGVRQRRQLHQFARNRERADGVVGDRWAFAGSVFYERDGKELYAADSAGGIIGLTGKGASVVQYAEQLGVPYQGEAMGLEAKEDAIPPVGTAVRVIFSLLTPPVNVPAPAKSTAVHELATPPEKP